MGGEWREVRLGQLGEVNRGRSRHRPRDAAHLYGGAYPFIQTGDIKASGGRITSHSQTYSEAGLAQSRLWPEGTMVITIAANIAETAILTYPACFPDSVVGFIADKQRADVRFVEYLFRHLRRQIQQENVGTGSVQDNINLQTLARLTLRIPEPREQRRIAYILGTLDDKIENNRKTAKTLEAMAQAIFQSWFVDFDPVRAKMAGESRENICKRPKLTPEILDLFPDRLVDSEFGEIPEGWEITTLTAMSTLNPESLTKAARPKLINYVDLSNTKWGRIESVTIYTQEDAPSRAQRILRPDDTIVGTVRPGNGSFALITENGLTGSTGFAVLRPKKTIYAAFVYLAVTAKENIQSLVHLADGGAYPAVRPEVVAATQVVKPCDESLATFSTLTSVLIRKFATIERQIRTLVALRDALLPKLISGEIRIHEAVKTTEEVLS